MEELDRDGDRQVMIDEMVDEMMVGEMMMR